MRYVNNTQTSLFALVRNIEEAPAVRALLDHQTLAPVTFAIEIAVANEDHVLLFSRHLGIAGGDKHHDSKEHDGEREANFAHVGCSAQ